MLFKPTWLYLKRHNKTGLLYFGKTVRKDPDKYLGSGVRWTNHLKKHGKDVSTVWKKLFNDPVELKEYALNYSKENNIVENQSYANLKPEDGHMGGDTGITDAGRKILSINAASRTHSEENKAKIRAKRALQPTTMLGKKHSEETKAKIRAKRALQVNIGLKGKTHSEETKRKISDTKRKIKGIIS
jgi:hypothetical protein